MRIHSNNVTKASTSQSPKDSIVLFDTDQSEVEAIIVNLKNNCATGVDDIPTQCSRCREVSYFQKTFDSPIQSSGFFRIFLKGLLYILFIKTETEILLEIIGPSLYNSV